MPLLAGTSLLERNRELETIGAHLDAACAGEGSLAIVEGPAEIGKTSLLAATTELAKERGMTVLAARGGVLEKQLEYGVARQLVERQVLSAGSERRAELLAGPAAASAAALGFGELPADPGFGGDPSPQIQHALHWLIANLAEEGPILIVVDDAHWGDVASLRAGGYLARRLDAIAVTMLVAARDDEPGSRQDLLAELFAAAEPACLRPAPLSAAAISAVLREAFADRPPPDELVVACERASGGNPFLLTELASELAAEGRGPEETQVALVGRVGPLAVRRSLLLRLGNLGDDARRLARAVAVMGGEAELRHAGRVAGLEPEAAQAAAAVLGAAGILEVGMPLRMVHPLVRAAIADDTPADDRANSHPQGAAGPQVPAGIVAPLFGSAGSENIADGEEELLLTVPVTTAGNFVINAKSNLFAVQDGAKIECRISAGGKTVDQVQWNPSEAIARQSLAMQAVAAATAAGPLRLYCAFNGGNGSTSESKLTAIPVG